jgi:hypothetical protein
MKSRHLFSLAIGFCSVSLFAQPKPPLPGQAAVKIAAPALPAATGKLTPVGDGSTVLSADGKLMWMRCHIGQHFEKGQCSGDPKKMDQRDAENEIKRMNFVGGYAGSKEWRLPTIVELQSIVFCEQGASEQQTVIKLTHEQSLTLAQSCKGESYLRPTIDPIIFPRAASEWVWSATPDQGRVINVWALNFASGAPSPVGRLNNQTAVRAVRFAK